MKHIFTLIILLYLTLSIFGQENNIHLKRFAIFTGSNDGGDQRVQLEYAETDAQAMLDVFSEVGGLFPADTLLVSDPNPEDIREAFETMKLLIEKEKSTAKRTEFFFYYSGHSDDMGILPGGEILDYSELRENIKNMDTDVKIAVLDSCSSGSFTRLKGGFKKAPFLIDESVDTTGHAFLTSSSENEAAQESDLIEGSFFTHYLITALRGAADSTQDGTVTLNEAYSFAAEETLARTSYSIAGAQHPSYSINLTGSGDLVLTDLREVYSTVALEKELDGRIYFRDQSDHLLIEFRKRAGLPVSISLPPGTYRVDLETDKGINTSSIVLNKSEVLLGLKDFSLVERTFARSRGDENIDESQSPPRVNGIDDMVNDTIDSVEESLDETIDKIRKIINSNFSTNEIDDSEKDEPQVLPDDLEYNVIGFSFVPTRSGSKEVRNLSFSFIGKPYAVNGFALGFINMTYGDSTGANIAALSNITGNDQYGISTSSLFNVNNGDMWGAAFTGLFNVSYGMVNGIQASGLFNYSTEDLNGIQATGLFNFSKGIVSGIQASGLFNYSSEGLNGVQASGLFNFSEGQVQGLQATGLFNYVNGTLKGAQLSGLFNVAENVDGVQISLINVAKKVRGMQIGLINVNDDLYGLPLGLLTISKNGIMDLGLWYEGSGILYTGIQSGTRNFYNFAYVGIPVIDSGKLLISGIGVGARINFKPFYIDLDVSIKSVIQGANYGDVFERIFTENNIYSLFPNARISAGFKMWNVVSIFGGLSLDMHIPNLTQRNSFSHNSPYALLIKDQQKTSNILEFHPNVFAGLKVHL